MPRKENPCTTVVGKSRRERFVKIEIQGKGLLPTTSTSGEDAKQGNGKGVIPEDGNTLCTSAGGWTQKKR